MYAKTAFDIDGVFCHTWKLMLELFNEKGYPVTEDDVTSFRLEDCLKVPVHVIREVIGESLARENMARKTVEQNAVWCASELHRVTKKIIPIITSRKEPKDTMYYLERYVVKGAFPYEVRHGSWNDGLSCGQRKLMQIREFGCVAMIEDAPETLDLLSKNHIIPILIDRPYNRYAKCALRFTDWWPVGLLTQQLEKANVL